MLDVATRELACWYLDIEVLLVEALKDGVWITCPLACRFFRVRFVLVRGTSSPMRCSVEASASRRVSAGVVHISSVICAFMFFSRW
jgi:hypothetical protein